MQWIQHRSQARTQPPGFRAAGRRTHTSRLVNVSRLELDVDGKGRVAGRGRPFQGHGAAWTFDALEGYMAVEARLDVVGG